jgi:hypothetical protein
VRDAWAEHDPVRVRSGRKGIALFTFYRKHRAGFLQFVPCAPGRTLKASAWAHAWSNHTLESGQPDDPRWSDGAGREVIAWPAGSFSGTTGDTQEDAKPNFTFRVGIDPRGGNDPRSGSVAWGKGYHVYNGYCQELTAEARAETDLATVFLEAVTMWPFKHNDGYWDDVDVIEVETEERRYRRTYVLLPPEMSTETAARLFAKHDEEEKRTVGRSADDAAARDPRLEWRRVIAYDAETSYPGGKEGLRAFWDRWYTEPDEVVWLDSGEVPGVLLWQADPRWGGDRLGDTGCELTLAQAGCYVTNLAMALRWYGIDGEATPAGVNEALKGGGFAPNAPCRPLWAAIKARIGLEIGSSTTEGAHAALDDEARRCVMAEVKPTSLEQFVLVTRREGQRYWCLDPAANREGWLDESYQGVESWRLVDKVEEEPPPVGIWGVTLHLQTMSFDWDQYVREAKPRTCKVFGLTDALGVRRVNAGTFPIVRIYDPNEFNYCFGYPNTPAGARDGARAYIRRFEDDARRIVDEIAREFPGLKPPFYAIEALNEGYATNGEHTEQIAQWETAYAALMGEMFEEIVPVTYCAAVGNIGEWEWQKIVELARVTTRVGGLLGYHGYWFANPQETGMTAAHWPYLHGRWAEIDKYLGTRGIEPRWFLAESGAVAGKLVSDMARARREIVAEVEPPGPWAFGRRPRVYYVDVRRSGPMGPGVGGMGGGYQLGPLDGWLSKVCYNGDLGRYVNDIVTFEGLCDAWNESHGGRFLGFGLFTTGEYYTGWESFQVRQKAMRAIIDALM